MKRRKHIHVSENVITDMIKTVFENTEITIKNKDCFEKQIKVYKYCWTIYFVFPKDDQVKA